MLRRIVGLAFLAWEVWWVYVYVAAPRPDEHMATVAAVLLGFFFPAAVVILAAAIILTQRVWDWAKPKPD